jgi:2-polyprenyl-6-methoxyphenol hydroxylase-like FAD-dependent oxidoreductase
MEKPLGDRAVVLGAGVAGLLAARVLADFYGEVTLVDRDDLPTGTEPRRGVPQGRHAHALLARGQQLLEDFFPGLTAELVAGGARTGDVLGATRMYLSGHRLRSAPSGLVALSASRALLEGRLRARVRDIPGVRVLVRCDAVGLTSVEGAVTGARLLRRADHSAEEVLDADVVIDATGRGSHAPTWLRAIGVEEPESDRIAIDVAYATRRYRLAADALRGDLAVVHGLTPSHPRGGVLALVEGDEAIVTLAGVLGDRPPTDADDFAGFARSLQFPDIHDALVDADPVDDPVPYRFPAAVWRRYERLRHVPDGFAVIGDSMCSFNPIYGQGMSIAALEAVALRDHLRRHGRLRPRRFHRRLAGVLRPAWQMATGADMALPSFDQQRTAGQRILGAYVTRLHARGARDAGVARSFVRVSGLVDPPRTLLRPSTAWRVLAPLARRSDSPNQGDESVGRR